MQNRVTDLVIESFGTQSYKKAMDCLRVLREESIKVPVSTIYCCERGKVTEDLNSTL